MGWISDGSSLFRPERTQSFCSSRAATPRCKRKEFPVTVIVHAGTHFDGAIADDGSRRT